MANKSKKKNGITLGILVVILLLVILCYILLINRNQSKEEEQEDTSIVLNNYEIEDVAELSIEQDNNTLHFIAEEEGFVMAGEEDFPLNQSQVELMVNTIAKLSAEGIVTQEPEDLEQYGLSKPQVTAKLKLKDGTSVTLWIGDTIPSNSSRYAKLDGSDTVYKISSSVRSYLEKTKKDLIQADELPTVSGTIQTIKIEDVNSTIRLFYEENNELDRSGSNVNPWVIEGVNGRMSADTSAVTELLDRYNSFSTIECVDYRKENFEQYGLLNPIKALRIFYLEETSQEETIQEETIPKEITLYFGSQDENGNYYVRTEDSVFTYLMSEETVNSLLFPDLESLIDKYAVRVNINTVEKISISYGKATHTAEIKRIKSTEITAEDETTQIEDNFILDGKEVGNDSEFRTYYQKLISLQGKEILEESVSLTEEPVLSIQIERNTDNFSTLKAEFFPYDSSYYIMQLEGTPKFLIDMRDVQTFIEETDKIFSR